MNLLEKYYKIVRNQARNPECGLAWSPASGKLGTTAKGPVDLTGKLVPVA